MASSVSKILLAEKEKYMWEGDHFIDFQLQMNEDK